MDLFGNPISSSHSKKAFKLSLSSPVSSKDKKKKTEIYACAKSIDEIDDKIHIATEQVSSIKQVYCNLTGNISSNLEKHWLQYIDQLIHFLQDEYFNIWEKELVYHLIYRELSTYKNFHLNVEPLIRIERQLSEFEFEKVSNQSQGLDNVEIKSYKDVIPSFDIQDKKNDADKHIDGNKPSITTFKKLYKSLLKQVHPDILFTSFEESEERIKELTSIWENKAYYQLLKFNHTINPASKIILNIGDLECMLSQLTEDLNEKQIELDTIYTSTDYIFYVEQFYNLSNHVTTGKIKDYKNTLVSKLTEIESMLLHINTSKTFKAYLNKARISLSEYLNIQYLIEDLYHTQQ